MAEAIQFTPEELERLRGGNLPPDIQRSIDDLQINIGQPGRLFSKSPEAQIPNDVQALTDLANPIAAVPLGMAEGLASIPDLLGLLLDAGANQILPRQQGVPGFQDFLGAPGGAVRGELERLKEDVSPGVRKTFQGSRVAGQNLTFVLGAALRGQQLIKNLGPQGVDVMNLFNRWFVAAARNPIRMSAVESAFAFPAGAAGEFAAQSELDKGGTREAAEIKRLTAELGTFIGPQLALALGTKLAIWVRRAGFGLSEEEARIFIGKVLNDVLNSQEGQIALQNSKRLREIGVTPETQTIAVQTLSGDLQKLTQEFLSKGQADQLTTAARKQIQEFTARVRPITELPPEEAFRQYSLEMDALVNNLATDIDTLNAIPLEKLQELAGAFATKTDASALAQTMFDSIIKTHREKLSAMYNLIPDFKVPDHVKGYVFAGIDDVSKEIARTKGVEIPESAQKTISEFNLNFSRAKAVELDAFKSAFGGTQPSARLIGEGTLTNLRDISSELGTALRVASRDRIANAKEIRLLVKLKERFDGAFDLLEIDPSIPTHSMVALKEANRARRSFAELAQTGSGKVALQRLLQGESRIANEDFLNLFLRKAGQKEITQTAEDFKRIFGAADLPQAQQLMTNHIALTLKGMATDPLKPGGIDRKIIQRYLKTYNDSLGALGIRSRFSTVDKAIAEIELQLPDLKASSESLQKNILNVFVKSDNPAVAMDKAIDEMTKGGRLGDAVFSTKKLRALFGEAFRTNNPQVKIAINQLFWDRMIARTMELKVDPNFNFPIYKSGDLLALVRTFRGVMKEILGTRHVDHLEDIAQAVIRTEPLPTTGAPLPVSPTEAGFVKTQRQTFSLFRQVDRGFIAPGFGAILVARKFGERLSELEKSRVLLRALTDVDYAEELGKFARTDAGKRVIGSIFPSVIFAGTRIPDNPEGMVDLGGELTRSYRKDLSDLKDSMVNKVRKLPAIRKIEELTLDRFGQ